MRRVIAFLFFCLAAVPVRAEQVAKFGDIEVHYNAMPTDELVPEVAKRHGLTRSKNRGLLTISVHQRTPLGVSQAMKAEVKTVIPMLTGQSVEVPMREVEEGTAIYYLGEYRVNPPETLRFRVSVTPRGGDKPLNVEFSRSFYK